MYKSPQWFESLSPKIKNYLILLSRAQPEDPEMEKAQDSSAGVWEREGGWSLGDTKKLSGNIFVKEMGT